MTDKEVQSVNAGTEGGLIRVCMKMALQGWRASGPVVRYDTPQGCRLSQRLVRDALAKPTPPACIHMTADMAQNCHVCNPMPHRARGGFTGGV